MSFKNLKGGDRIKCRIPNGIGRSGVEYKVITARVQPLLVFDTHVVASRGGRFGTPVVVDERNFVGRA